MALGFFRKRQKLIFIIMVALMVSFLIGFQGFSMLFQKSPGKQAYGRTPDYKITVNTLRQARADLDLLRTLARGFGRYSPQGAAFQALFLGGGDEHGASLAYALLLEQAREDGFGVTAPEIEREVQDLKANGLDYDGLAARLRQNQDLPEKQLRGVLGRWLILFKAFEANQSVIPPSREELIRLFQDVAEKINLRAVKISAEAFVGEVKDPTDAEIQKQFETYRNLPAGRFTGLNHFSFGYLEPAKVELAYLFIRQSAIEQASTPGDQDVTDYVNAHKDELAQSVAEAAVASSQPAGAPATPEAIRAAAVAKLREQAAKAKFSDLQDRLSRIVREEAPSPESRPTDVYAEAVAKLTGSAEELLGRKALILAIDQQPLDKALEMLAAAAQGVQAICFPRGRYETVDLTTKKVSLFVTNLTVGEALEKLLGQVPDLPKVQWACCEGFPNVLFPVEGVRFFPVTAGRTGLVTQQQLQADPLLSRCVSQELRQTLPQLAMQTAPINPKSSLQVGQEGPTLSVWNAEDPGQLLWRPLAAQPPKSPSALTDDLRKDVVRDWKIAQAFPLAQRQAEAIRNAAELDKYIRDRKLQPVETQLVARKVLFDYAGGSFVPTRVPELKFSNPAVDRNLLQAAFDRLAPKDLDQDYPQASQEVLDLPLPCEACVVVAQRIDYEPAEKKLFERDKAELMIFLERQQFLTGLEEWFRLPEIERRTGFRLEQEK